MIESTMSKVGNSMAVLLPKALRTKACLGPDDPLYLESPRKGVIVISALFVEGDDRLARLKNAETRIKARQSKMPSWPKGATADNLLKSGKDARAHELTPV